MTRINSDLLKLLDGYSGARGEKCSVENPDTIRLDGDDVSLPVTKAIINVMHEAVDEMADRETFRGYAPEEGYAFLIDAMIKYEYTKRGVKLERDEVFVSDGSKCDLNNIQEVFDISSAAAVCSPSRQSYREGNIAAGRKVVTVQCAKDNDFLPVPPCENAGFIYLSSPCNSTGAVFTSDKLSRWVAYARDTGAVIFYDSTYSAYIGDESLPSTIYEVEGAKEVAIEFKSLSMSAGFSGLRCSFITIPKELEVSGVPLNGLWRLRQKVKFGGVSYITQRAAAAVYTERGRMESIALINYYMGNAHIILSGLKDAGFEVYGGEHAPYIWWKLPEGAKSLDFVEKLLTECLVASAPGVSFGDGGEGYVRLSALGDRERTFEAVERIREAKCRLF